VALILLWPVPYQYSTVPHHTTPHPAGTGILLQQKYKCKITHKHCEYVRELPGTLLYQVLVYFTWYRPVPYPSGQGRVQGSRGVPWLCSTLCSVARLLGSEVRRSKVYSTRYCRTRYPYLTW
jgi:hypothetical protein